MSYSQPDPSEETTDTEPEEQGATGQEADERAGLATEVQPSDDVQADPADPEVPSGS